MFDSVLITVLPLGLLLAICVFAELVLPRESGVVRGRFPGAFFILLLPAFGVIASYPLRQFWDSLGFPPLLNVSGMSSFAIFVGIVLFRDFCNYWQHRFDHRFLWSIHSAHHAVTDLHAANGFGHPLQYFSEFLFIVIPLSLIETGGLELPLALSWAISIQAMIIHSPLRIHLGPLRRLVVDNRFHRIHHSLEERHFDRNFGTVFSIWDQLFGTAYFPEADEWPETGVEGMAQPRSLGTFLAHPLRQVRVRSGSRGEAGSAAIVRAEPARVVAFANSQATPTNESMPDRTM